MDIKDLRYFIAIAEERQISAAARRLNMSQPPLSHQLKLLEEEVGVPLAVRGPRHIELTDAGRLLYDRARQILGMVDSTRRNLSDFGAGMAGVLSVGTISSSGGVVPTRGMKEFTSLYPYVRFEVYDGNTFSVMDMLRKGVIDVGVVRTPFASANLACRYAEMEPMVAVMTKRYLCGKDASTISLKELEHMPLILYRRFETMIREQCVREGFEPYVACINDDARTTISWTKAGFGVGIMPRSALLTVGSSSLIVKDVDCAALQTRIAVIWQEDRELSPLARRFIDLFGQEEPDGT